MTQTETLWPQTPDTLTPFERQSLINQYKILAKLEPDEAPEYEKYIRILREGYSIKYEEVFETHDEMTVEECRYVFDVLDMYRILRFSFNELEDKDGITEDNITFEGFDGNNESNRLGFLHFLRDDGLWQETLGSGGEFNSHSIMTMSRYPRMLAKFNPIYKKKVHLSDNLLTADEIREVIAN